MAKTTNGRPNTTKPQPKSDYLKEKYQTPEDSDMIVVSASDMGSPNIEAVPKKVYKSDDVDLEFTPQVQKFKTPTPVTPPVSPNIADNPNESIVRPVQSKNLRGPSRSVGWAWRSMCGIYGILRITIGKGMTEYFVKQVASSVFTVTTMKASRTSEYTVLIGKARHCGCSNFANSGGKSCNHLDALTALRQAGKA